MRDIFYLFHKANSVYELLRQSHDVDVSLPSLLDGALSLEVKMIYPDQEAKAQRLQGEGHQFSELPRMLRGNVNEVCIKVEDLIKKLKMLDTTLYKQFGEALSSLVTATRIKALHSFFLEVLTTYNKVEEGLNVIEEIDVKFKWDYPGKLIYYCTRFNQGLLYNFCDNKMTLSGFQEPELVKIPDTSNIDLIVSGYDVKETPISENAIYLKLPSMARLVLLEAFPYDEDSTDAVLDNVIQLLVINDAIDGLQDIIIDDDDDAVLFCFDPILNLDEVNKILNEMKQMYPQALIAATPNADENISWWVIEVGRVAETATQVAAAGSEPVPDEGEPMVKTGATPIDDIARDVDVDKAMADL